MIKGKHLSQRYVGQSVRAKELRAPLVGKAKYTNDYSFEGQLYAYILRSPHAAAKINSVDLSGAKKISGVHLALCGRDVFKHTNGITDHLNPAIFGGNIRGRRLTFELHHHRQEVLSYSCCF